MSLSLKKTKLPSRSYIYHVSHNSILHICERTVLPIEKKKLLHPSSFHRLAGAAGTSLDGRPQRRGMSASMRAPWRGPVDGWNGRCIDKSRGLRVV